MLKIVNLTKYYGKNRGVENLNLEVKTGEIFGFIGPNGAGKSTTIRCIMNLINKTKGDIFINDQKIFQNDYSYRKEIGYLPGEVNLYEDMKVKDILNYSEGFYSKDCSKRVSELVEKLELDTNKLIRELSLGNLKKVGIIISMMHSPKLLILDEATSGLDPLMQNVFYNLLLEEKKKGTTIFFSSHNLNEIKKICDRVGIIKEGKLIKIEEIKNIRNNNMEIVTIKSIDNKKIIKDLGINSFKEDDGNISFIYNDLISKLLKIISKYDIEKLHIEDPSIEEIFMHYYK